MDRGRINRRRHGGILVGWLVGWLVEAAAVIVVEAAVFVAVASEAEAVVPPAVSMPAAHPAAAMVGRDAAERHAERRDRRALKRFHIDRKQKPL